MIAFSLASRAGSAPILRSPDLPFFAVSDHDNPRLP